MCSTGCPTKDHETYGACMRAKGSKVAYANSAGGWDYSTQKAHDRELDAYKQARREGIQPSSTKMPDIERAKAISDLTGSPFQADASNL